MTEIYIDGSSRRKNGDGGYGLVIFEDNQITYARSAQFSDVTNNQMELTALIDTLEFCHFHYPTDKIMIFCDSTYVVNSYNEWIDNWAHNGWLDSKKQPVKNRVLMEEILEYIKRPFYRNRVQVKLCKGHDGILGNELADYLATGNIDKYIKISQEEGFYTSILDEVDNR